jgi:hypothetical protein
VTEHNKELGALLSWALRNGFRAHVSTGSGHLIVLAKADRQTTRIAHLRDHQPAAAALLSTTREHTFSARSPWPRTTTATSPVSHSSSEDCRSSTPH